MALNLSVIIPCYNEHNNLKRGVLNEVDGWLKHQRFNYEVIVSDDASTDNSREVVKKIVKSHQHVRLLENQHGGKAWALKHGLDKAKGDWVLFTDMDQSTPISELNKLLDKKEKDCQVIIGSRGKLRDNFSILRKLASNSFRIFRKSLLLNGIDDTQCGFKLVNTMVARKLFDSMKIFEQSAMAKGWVVAAWDVEFLFLAEKFGYGIAEVPVAWSDKDASTSKNRNFKKFANESIDMLKQVTRVRLNEINGLYDK
jgi:dolichyl-phosphate beta-glucosyltransferase